MQHGYSHHLSVCSPPEWIHDVFAVKARTNRVEGNEATCDVQWSCMLRPLSSRQQGSSYIRTLSDSTLAVTPGSVVMPYW